ncbi:hypothetical protein FDECE_6600 [Fusarium decemcellulare]|nr:hypothetical protein FDECE_6600 [Fusarium decemcellulare]
MAETKFSLTLARLKTPVADPGLPYTPVLGGVAAWARSPHAHAHHHEFPRHNSIIPVVLTAVVPITSDQSGYRLMTGMAPSYEEPTDTTSGSAVSRPRSANTHHDSASSASLVQAAFLAAGNVHDGNGPQHNGHKIYTCNKTFSGNTVNILQLPAPQVEALPPKTKVVPPKPVDHRGLKCSDCQRYKVLTIALLGALGRIIQVLLRWGVVRGTRRVL